MPLCDDQTPVKYTPSFYLCATYEPYMQTLCDSLKDYLFIIIIYDVSILCTSTRTSMYK